MEQSKIAQHFLLEDSDCVITVDFFIFKHEKYVDVVTEPCCKLYEVWSRM